MKPTGEFPCLPVLPDRELGGEDPLLKYDNQDTHEHEISKTSINMNNILQIF